MNTRLVENWLAEKEDGQQRLLQECSISASTLRLIRRGYRPSDKVVKLLANVLGVKFQELVTPTTQAHKARAR